VEWAWELASVCNNVCWVNKLGLSAPSMPTKPNLAVFTLPHSSLSLPPFTPFQDKLLLNLYSRLIIDYIYNEFIKLYDNFW